LISVAPAPAYERLCPISPPGLILLVWLLSEQEKFSRWMLKALWFASLALALAVPLRRQTQWRGQLDLPRGRTAFLDPVEFNKFEWLQQRTRPSEYIYEADFPRVYYSLALRDPAEVNIVTPNDYTRPEQVEQAVGSLEKRRVQFVLWMDALDIPYENHTEGNHLAPLEEYLRQHYRVVKTFATEQVWERIE
jgi:hypothetical protein